METIFMNTENRKTNKSHRFRLDSTDKLNLKNPKKKMALANLNIEKHKEKHKNRIQQQ